MYDAWKHLHRIKDELTDLETQKDILEGLIKQSMGVMIAMFGGWAYTILFCVGFLLLPGWKLGFAGYMGAFIGLNLVLCAKLYLWLKKRGCEILATL